jgi:hypothetical protein
MLDLTGLLSSLDDGGVRFVIVGGAAAVLQRAPVTTLDLDIVHDRDPGNVRRLMAVLTGLRATVRDLAGRVLYPSESALLGNGQVLLSTAKGELDCLGALHDGRGYAELLPHCDRIADRGHEILVINLPTLIQIKTAAGRPKDRLVVPILLAELQRREAIKR